MYDDSLSYYELLCKVSDNLNEVIANSNVQNKAIEELQQVLDEFLSGDIDPYIEEKVDEWFLENEPSIVADIESLQENEAFINDLNDSLHLMKIQERFETNGNSKYELEFNDDVAEPFVSTSNPYLPFLVFYNGMQQCSLIGDFKTKVDLSNSSQDRVIFTTFLKTSQNWVVHDILTYNDSNGNLATASLIWNANGELLYFSPDGATLPADTRVHIDQGAFSTSLYHGSFDFPHIDSGDIAGALAWIRNHQGYFSYSNALYAKDYAQSNGDSTDCSGLIFCAFYYAVNKVVPNFSDIQGGFGKVVSFARVGEDLDLSDAVAGDIVMYIRPDVETAHHCSIYDGANLWEQDTVYSGGQEAGPQIVAGGTITNENYLKSTDFRMIVRWSEHYNDTYNWQDIIQGE